VFPAATSAGPSHPVTPPAPPPAGQAAPSSVRLRGDELVTFSGNKRDAKTFMFLAKRLITEQKLSVPVYGPRIFTDEARTWVVKLMQAYAQRGTELTWDIVWREFAACYLYDRVPNWEVRQHLFSRKYVQKARQSVPEYMSEFRHTVLFADDLSETDQVSWFLAGLVSEIAADCQTDHRNRPYTVLQELYEAARSVELRLVAQGRRQLQGAPSHLTASLTNPSTNLHRPRNALIRKGPTNSVQGRKRPFPSPQRGGGQWGRGRGRGRSAGRSRGSGPSAERTSELNDWIRWCTLNGSRCIECGQPGHWKDSCRSPSPMRRPEQWKAFMEAHTAPRSM
jgi:hypothetical protein